MIAARLINVRSFEFVCLWTFCFGLCALSPLMSVRRVVSTRFGCWHLVLGWSYHILMFRHLVGLVILLGWRCDL